MKCSITQFTFDTRNHVFITDFVITQLQKIINKQIFQKLPVDKAYNNWSLEVVISSDARYARQLHVNGMASRSAKSKTIRYYIYFPRLTVKQDDSNKPQPYSPSKFISYFITGLQTILKGWELDESIFKQCKKLAKEKIIGNPAAAYDVKQEITLTAKEIRSILRTR